MFYPEGVQVGEVTLALFVRIVRLKHVDGLQVRIVAAAVIGFLITAMGTTITYTCLQESRHSDELSSSGLSVLFMGSVLRSLGENSCQSISVV